MKYNLSEMETELAEIIWEREPLKSSELVDICAEKFDWKKSTTYTMIKRIENKGVIINEDGIVKSTISRKDFYAGLSSNYVKNLLVVHCLNLLQLLQEQKNLVMLKLKKLRP